jgi:hypothetical protein
MMQQPPVDPFNMPLPPMGSEVDGFMNQPAGYAEDVNYDMQ